MRNANLFILGVQKCGTTSLANHLNSHPEAFVPSIKETYHFCLDENYQRGSDYYETEFFIPAAAQSARYRGDATPFYLASDLALERIAAYCVPESRFIVILRDPVSRAVSAYRHQLRLGNEPLSLEDALDAEAERIAAAREAKGRWWRHAYVTVGKYGAQLDRAFAILGRERFLVLPQQALRDTAALNARLTDFLGLTEPFASTEIVHENPAAMPRLRFVRSLITTQNPLKSLAQAVIPREARSRIGRAINSKNAKPAEDVAVSDATRARLAAAFVEDRARFGRLGLDADPYVASDRPAKLSGTPT